MRKPLAPDTRTVVVRSLAITLSVVAALSATVLLAEAAIQDGLDAWDVVRSALIFITTAWLAWGASLAFTGLPGRALRAQDEAPRAPQPPTVVLVPICNEDPVATFARIAAMDSSSRAAGIRADFAILSDTRDEAAALKERHAYVRLLEETGGQGRIFYRRRSSNRGRKAGNIEEFIRTSGGAYEFAVILDADSLMEGATIRTMIARMQADPRLGLLQTLPRVIGSRSLFGRAMQFAAAFHGPVFTRGLARMQGHTGPFWGHNAIVRVRAFAESCALPELTGRPPFGGHILSHDYVEAALLARAGWSVRVDGAIEGSYEEGPDNLLAYARRDRRWCQGNLQHMRLLTAPGLSAWSRFVFVQGIFAYLVSLLWGGFMLASIAATLNAPAPDYFPEPHALFPVFPSDRSKEITALVFGIAGLLVLPKVAIWTGAALSGRDRGFGGTLKAGLSVLTEIALSSVIAPVMLMYQSRSVLQVLSGRDGGWPANQRGEGRLRWRDGVQAGLWISAVGAVTLLVASSVAPDLAPWLLPVCLPMLAAPALITLTSRRLGRSLFDIPEERDMPDIVRLYTVTHASWQNGAQGKARQATPETGVADVAL
ncbi:glucans biosynthesis glucosyltransferase MdoH [Pararhodobacter marinus]|uniref:Glucans biosynthesis glucosyltransferase H n=1 Tax=Pararhodobacter marinus TaxID=2184063 RepID=A0A2U2C7I6_9RHOB|nr:glucans biosynthesis glucosyltransferase MdoH [Pararhodobacter marinus]PWE27811.1 glucans biosynthesis glucosyltransferase MdoH [Pararhodobacter marinus]